MTPRPVPGGPRRRGPGPAAVAAAWLLVSACVIDPARTKGLAPLPGVSTADVAAGFRPRRVALVIGVNAPADPAWSPLRYPEDDAAHVARTLRDEAVGGFDEVAILRGAESSRTAVFAALDALALLAPSPDDIVVVYVSGHGALAPTREGPTRVVVLADTRRTHLLATGLPVDELARRLDALPSRRKALVLATCHSGARSGLLAPSEMKALQRLKGPAVELVSRASIVLSASGLGQTAREDDRLGADVYTHFLLEALESRADANGDGAVTATEAHDWARRRTYEFTAGEQLPVLEATIAGADPVVLAGRADRPGLPVLYGYAPGLEGLTVTVGGRRKGTLPGDVVLEPGPQEITLERDGERSGPVRATISVFPGQRVDAAELWTARTPRWELRAGWRSFALLSGGLSDTTLAPLGGPAVALVRRDLPAAGLMLGMDAAWLGSAGSVAPAGAPVTMAGWGAQAGLSLALASELGPLRFEVGPRLGFVHLERSFQLGGATTRQAFGTLLPGVRVGVGASWDRFHLRFGGDLQWLPLTLDGENRSVAAGAAELALGWSF